MDTLMFPEVIELNVGGELTTTLHSTLTKDSDSMLAAMFSGRHVINKDKDGHYFIDCDGKLFQHILNFLRFESLPPAELASEVHALANYFNIQSLLKQLEDFHFLQYRKRSVQLKTGYGDLQYETLKREAINAINMSNCSPRENKVLHIIQKSFIANGHTGHRPETLRSYQARGITISAIALLEIRQKVYGGILRLLAYDLCELGYGKYTDAYLSNCSNVCSCTLDHISCKQIVLFTNCDAIKS